MSSISKLAAVLFPVLLAMPALAAPQTFTLTGDSSITYIGNHPAHHWQGVSKALKGTFRLDDGTTGTPVTLSVPVRSFDSGNHNRDANALTYMEASKFPQVLCRIDRVEVLDKAKTATGMTGKARCSGAITFHGVTRPVSFVLSGVLNGNQLNADGEFAFTLSEFKVPIPALLFVPMEDKVGVKVHVVAVGK